MLLLGLAGCGTGEVGEARSSQRRDARETPVLPIAQATRIAERLFPPTATPAPTPPLPALVGQLVVTLAINGDGSPQGSYASVPTDAGTLYASARLHGAAPGQVMTAIWSDAWGNEVGRSDQVLAAPAPVQWVALPLGLSPAMTPGPYAVWLYSDERRVASLAFDLTAPGTAPQIYPDLPTNPQAPAAPAPTSPPSGGESPTVAPVQQ